MALKVKVGLIGALDMLKFKNLSKTRREAIEALPERPLPKTYETNEKANFMHPKYQDVRIKAMVPNGSDAVTVTLCSLDGRALAPFRAGQYVSISVDADASTTTRSYSLCSSPTRSWEGEYDITVKRVEDDGFISKFIQDKWKPGEPIRISAPQGHLYYEPLRDEKRVIALAGGSGITPFVGMANAIMYGAEDFDLTILYGSRLEKDILYRDKLDAIAASCPKVHVVHVLSDEDKEGFEKGFLSAELIRKYAAGEPYTVFMCGPQAMYNFLDGVVAELGLDQKHVRRELFGMIKDPWNQPGYPKGAHAMSYLAKVTIFDKTYTIPISSSESLLTAFDRAGLCTPSRCRSGECGWCRSRLISGDVFIPEKTDGRREADKEFGYIHPCSTFPLSDVVVEVPGQYQHR